MGKVTDLEDVKLRKGKSDYSPNAIFAALKSVMPELNALMVVGATDEGVIMLSSDMPTEQAAYLSMMLQRKIMLLDMDGDFE